MFYDDIDLATLFIIFLLRDCPNVTHGKKLNSVQEFIKAKSYQLLIFSTCLSNQLKCRCLSKVIYQVD